MREEVRKHGREEGEGQRVRVGGGGREREREREEGFSVSCTTQPGGAPTRPPLSSTTYTPGDMYKMYTSPCTVIYRILLSEGELIIISLLCL